MKWTHQLPSKPGFYWARTALSEAPEIVEVVFRGTVPGRFVFDGEAVVFRPLSAIREFSGVPWAGPIPLPEDDG